MSETNVERLQDGLLTILTAAVKRARRGDPRSDVDVAEFVMQNWPNTTRLLTTDRDQPPEGAVRVRLAWAESGAMLVLDAEGKLPTGSCYVWKDPATDRGENGG